MGMGTSIFLIALGAIMRFAVTATVSGISVQTVGTILMVVGVMGLVMSFIFWSSWGAGWGRRRTYADRDEAARDERYDDIDRAA